jgi:hypothetical protein
MVSSRTGGPTTRTGPSVVGAVLGRGVAATGTGTDGFDVLVVVPLEGGVCRHPRRTGHVAHMRALGSWLLQGWWGAASPHRCG